MYVINKKADGHHWLDSPPIEQPAHGRFTKMYCVFCGVKAYTVGQDKLSLTGEYYSGEIHQCPGGAKGFVKSMKKVLKKKKKARKKAKRKLKHTPKLVRHSPTLMRRTK